MNNRENRIDSITFDLKETINDLIHEFKEIVKEVDKIKETLK